MIFFVVFPIIVLKKIQRKQHPLPLAKLQCSSVVHSLQWSTIIYSIIVQVNNKILLFENVFVNIRRFKIRFLYNEFLRNHSLLCDEFF